MAFVYNNGAKLLNGSYWTTATLKAVLVDPSYVADRDHVFMSSIGASETSVSGYSRGFNSPGRKVLSSMSVVVDNTNNRVTFGSANPSWSVFGTAGPQAVVILEEKTSDADSLLIAYVDTASVVTGTGGTYTAVPSSGSWAAITT